MLPKISILIFVLLLALVFSICANAQCTETVIAFPSSNSLTISFPSEVGTNISFPVSGGVRLEQSCDGLVVYVPVGATPTIAANMRFLLVVNARKIDAPVTMDLLPYEITFPRGGKISIKGKQIAGIKYEDITFEGSGATLRPTKPLVK